MLDEVEEFSEFLLVDDCAFVVFADFQLLLDDLIDFVGKHVDNPANSLVDELRLSSLEIFQLGVT